MGVWRFINKFQLKQSAGSSQVVCQAHGDDDPESNPVVPVDVVGRIVGVRGARYIFAPCCATVQEYVGDGMDFAHQVCPHTPPERPPSRRVRVKCAQCEGPALPFPHQYVDHLETKMTVAYLCHRHTPPYDWLKHAANRRQFDQVVNEWDKKMRQKHRRG